MEWGVGPGAACHIDSLARQGRPRGHASGAGPFSGEGHTIRDPELVERAQRAAARLESAWEQSRAPHRLAVAPGQPVVSYAGYSLKEPWVNPGSSSESTLTRLNTSRSSSTAMNASSGRRFRSSRDGGPNCRRRAPVSTLVLRCSARRSATAPLAGSGPRHGHRASRLEPRRASRPGNRSARRVAAGPPDGHGSAADRRIACRWRSRLCALRLFWCLSLCACRAAVPRSFSLAEAGSQLCPSVR